MAFRGCFRVRKITNDFTESKRLINCSEIKLHKQAGERENPFRSRSTDSPPCAPTPLQVCQQALRLYTLYPQNVSSLAGHGLREGQCCPPEPYMSKLTPSQVLKVSSSTRLGTRAEPRFQPSLWVTELMLCVSASKWEHRFPVTHSLHFHMALELFLEICNICYSFAWLFSGLISSHDYSFFLKYHFKKESSTGKETQLL